MVCVCIWVVENVCYTGWIMCFGPLLTVRPSHMFKVTVTTRSCFISIPLFISIALFDLSASEK